MQSGFIVLLCVAWCACSAAAAPHPDSDAVDPPPPGLAYGGIPYGSMSGNVAEYFRQRQQTAPSVLRRVNHQPNDVEAYFFTR